MIDLSRYKELSLKGVVSLVKAGTSYAVSYKRFDYETGEVLANEVLGVNLKELADRKVQLQAEIVQIDAFVASCNKLV